MRLLLAALLLLTSPAQAQTAPPGDPNPVLPALYDVIDTASDDVLNIRTRPGTDGEIIGGLAHDATDVEVVRLSDDTKWGLVNRGEQAGWASMRYLSRSDSEDDLMERPLVCHGNEPFWDLTLTGAGNAVFTDYNLPDGPLALAARWTAREPFIDGGMEMASFTGGNTQLSLGLRRAYCDDGMADYEYGIRLLGVLTTQSGSQNYSGCCTLTLP